MKVHFDPEVDALYVTFSDDKIVETEEVQPGVMFDYDANDRIVAIEILQASKNLSTPDLKRLALEIV